MSMDIQEREEHSNTLHVITFFPPLKRKNLHCALQTFSNIMSLSPYIPVESGQLITCKGVNQSKVLSFWLSTKQLTYKKTGLITQQDYFLKCPERRGQESSLKITNIIR